MPDYAAIWTLNMPIRSLARSSVHIRNIPEVLLFFRAHVHFVRDISVWRAFARMLAHSHWLSIHQLKYTMYGLAWHGMACECGYDGCEWNDFVVYHKIFKFHFSYPSVLCGGAHDFFDAFIIETLNVLSFHISTQTHSHQAHSRTTDQTINDKRFFVLSVFGFGFSCSLHFMWLHNTRCSASAHASSLFGFR